MSLPNSTSTEKKSIMKNIILADYLVMAAAGISFLFSIYLWFCSNKEQGLFVGLWVPSIISLGVYFRVVLGSMKS